MNTIWSDYVQNVGTLYRTFLVFRRTVQGIKTGGVCLVLSARRGINIMADCVAEQSSLEKEIWARVDGLYQDINGKYNVG